MKNILLYALIIILIKINSAFTKSKYQHMPHGKFRNPEGSPIRDLTLNGHTRLLMKRKEKNLYLQIMSCQKIGY